MQTEDNLRLGMPQEQAHREAVLKFGAIESAKECYRDQRGLPQLDLLLQDWRYGLRQLRRTPGFTAFALLALAVGIGANATVFSVVNQILLKPPAYRDPNRLVLFQSVNPRKETLEGYSSYDDFRDVQRQSKMLEGISAVSPRWSFTLLGLGAAEQVQGQWVSASLFRLLGVNPILGRTFTPAEDTPGNVQGVILSYELWQRAYGGSTSVIGTQIRIDNSSAPIVGVMPRGFRFLSEADLWVPLAPNFVNQRGRGTRYLTVAGRLAPGVTIDQARAEMSAIMKGFATKYTNTNSGFSPKLTLLRDFLTTDTRPILLMLAGAVMFVLLIACANVANLTLTRTLARRQELAVRIALGAGRMRLIRQLVSESMLLSTIGGTLGSLAGGLGHVFRSSCEMEGRAGVRRRKNRSGSARLRGTGNSILRVDGRSAPGAASVRVRSGRRNPGRGPKLNRQRQRTAHASGIDGLRDRADQCAIERLRIAVAKSDSAARC